MVPPGLDPGAVAETEREQDSKRRELLGIATDHPELLDRLEDVEPLVEALGGDTDIIDSARRFVDALESDVEGD